MSTEEQELIVEKTARTLELLNESNWNGEQLRMLLNEMKEALLITSVVVTSCGCNRPRYLDKKDVLRCVGCDKKSIIL